MCTSPSCGTVICISIGTYIYFQTFGVGFWVQGLVTPFTPLAQPGGWYRTCYAFDISVTIECSGHRGYAALRLVFLPGSAAELMSDDAAGRDDSVTPHVTSACRRAAWIGIQIAVQQPHARDLRETKRHL